jgi:hypothetical protein
MAMKTTTPTFKKSLPSCPTVTEFTNSFHGEYATKASEYETKASEYKTKANEYETKASEYKTKASGYKTKANMYGQCLLKNQGPKMLPRACQRTPALGPGQRTS